MFVGRGLESISSKSVSASTTSLIISDNEFQSLESLHFLLDLEEIIADNNRITESIKIPRLMRLKTLSLNKNQIRNIDQLLDELVEKTPNLALLSLLGNPASPDPIYKHLFRLQCYNEEQQPNTGIVGADETVEDDDEEYQRYRWRILYRLPKLQFLDSLKVSNEEREEASRRGEFLQVKQPGDPTNTEQKSNKTLNFGILAPSRISEWVTGLNVTSISSSDTTYSPLVEPKQKKTPKVLYGKNQYVYKGRYSEGNRFIHNVDL